MKTILLVEDDPLLIDIYTTKLKEAGFEIQVARDGEEALKKIKKHNLPTPKKKKPIWPDLLLLDIILPGTIGWEILEKIKAEKKFKDLKVIILSNLGQKQEVEKGISLGATKYLVKAYYTPTQVVEEIKKVLK